MPQWMITEQSDDVLDQIMKDIEKEIEDNPDFEDVAGISTERLMRHANTAIASAPIDLHTTAGLLQFYAMAFVIGVKFGRKNPA